MRICVVAPNLRFPRTIGGLVHQVELCNALARRGHDVHLITQSLGSFSENIREGVTVHEIKPSILPEPFDRIPLFFKTLVLILRIHNKFSFQIIHDRGYLFGGAGTFASVLLHLPVILQIDDNWFKGIKLHSEFISRFNRILLVNIGGPLAFMWLKQLIPNVDRLVCVSDALREMVSTEWHVDKEKISVVQNAANLDAFNPNIDKHVVQAKYKLTEGKIVIFVGEIAPWQGLEPLLEAMSLVVKHFPSVLTLIVGGVPRPESNYYERVVSLSERLNLSRNVKFLGIIPYSEIPYLLASADVAVAPFASGFRDLSFSPLKIFEYMASGKPIVASNISWIREILEDGATALLVEQGNAEELAEAISRILSDEALRERLSSNARKVVEEKFSWDSVAEKMEQTYCELINNMTYKNLLNK